MGVDLVIVARTDALGATLLDNNVDPLDHPFILGCVDPENDSKVATFPQAGRDAINSKFQGEARDKLLKLWDEKCYVISLEEAM